MALGKFLTVHEGMDFSGGSLEEEYDSVRNGTTTWVFALVPRVPDSQQRFLVEDTSTIHVLTRGDVVERICHPIDRCKELISEGLCLCQRLHSIRDEGRTLSLWPGLDPGTPGFSP